MDDLDEVDWRGGLDADMWEGLGRILNESLKHLGEDPKAARQAQMLALNFTDALRDKVGEWPLSQEQSMKGSALMYAGLHVMESLRKVAGYPSPDDALEMLPPIDE